MRDQAHKFFYSTDVPIKQHELKLTLLGDIVAQAAEPEEMIMFIDGDAFPVAPIVPFLREKLERYPIVAVRRDENNGDPQPHPSFCVMRAGLWRELPGDWRRGATWVNPQGKEVTDVGGNLHRLLEDRGIDWYPMLRTNKVNPHPLQFGVYEDLVYHHGGGFRRTAGGRLWRAAAEDRLNATPAGPACRETAAEGARWQVPEVHPPGSPLSRGARRGAGADQRAGLRPDPARRGVLPPADRSGSRRRAGDDQGAGAARGRQAALGYALSARAPTSAVGANAAREAKIRSPSSEPVSGSTACSG